MFLARQTERDGPGRRSRSIAGGASPEPDEAVVVNLDTIRRAALLAVLVFALAYGALALTRFNDRTASVWLANAVILGVVIRAPRREWWVLLSVAFAANFGANLAHHDPLARAALLALFNIVESAIVIHLMARAFDRTARFDDGEVIARFLLYAGAVAPLCGAVLAAGALALLDGIDFATTLLHWYIADALGLLTLGALFLAAQATTEATPRGSRVASWVGVVVAGAATVVAFTFNPGPSLFAVAPVLMIATLRAPIVGSMIALVGCVSIAVAATAIGVGPLARPDLDPAMQMYLLQAFIASLLFVVLPVRALIGERERLSGVIARSERLFSRIAEASPAGTIHFDRLGRPTFANQRWTEMTGLDRDGLGDDDRWLEAIDPADRSAARSLWARARATLEPCSDEYRFCARGASAGFAELHFYPAVDEGRVLGFVARLTDVSARRRAEDTLRDREARHRLMTENAQDVILRLGPDGCPLYVSGASLRVTGYAPAELVGRRLAELIHPDDVAVFERTLERLAAGNADASIEFRLRHRDGHYRWFESNQRPLFDRDGAPLELVASLRDIDLRRRSEQLAVAASVKLRETNRLLLLAEELAGVGSWQLNTRERELDLAPEINRILGRASTDGPRIGEILKIVHGADRRRLIACLARARRRPGSAECALRVHAADGMRHVRLVAQAEQDGAGNFAGWVGVAHDVTDKVLTEAALIEARDEARAAAQAKSHFLATMSHEIRTPMTGVLGMIELLRDDPLPHERERFFGALKQSAGLLMAVLDDVLDFSKIDSGALRLEQADFDIVALAMTTLDLFGEAASRKGLCASFDSSCHPPALVRGDAVRLQQILSNLLSNAIKFTERGEVSLRLSCKPAADGDLRYRFAVTDSGIGLEPGQIERLFGAFIQADVTTARRYGGTGLGLAICRRLVEKMGGRLEVDSRAGLGSTFSFDIALPEGRAVEAEGFDMALPEGAAVEAFQASALADLGDAGQLDVLVAEDNAINQLLVAALVRGMGYHATVVDNGRQAVEAAAAKRFDAILMDMQMPELDGLAATRAIRASGGPSANSPIFALTADASAERRRFYDGAGLTDFLTKPIDRVALAARLALLDAPLARPGAMRPVANAPLLDPGRIEELRTALGELRFNALLVLLVTECRERPARLRAAHRRGDLAAIHAEAHSLKGAATSIGAAALGHAALPIEQAADLGAAEPLIDALAETARVTLVAAKRLGSRPSGDRASA